MPRPTQSNVPSYKGGESKNPIVSWLASLEARRMEARNEAAKLVTNEASKNQNLICAKLLSVDFDKSKLPARVLEQKTISENQKLCDLEEGANDLARTLRDDTQVIKVDIRKFDQKLLSVVLLFKEAVEHGDTQAAYMAQNAISRAVNDIRSRIPQVNTNLLKQYVEVNSTYMEDWINLITMAQAADRKKNNLIEKRENHEERIMEQRKKVVKLRDEIIENEVYAKAYSDFMEGKLPKERSKWSEHHRKVHKLMIDARMQDVVVDMSGYRLQQMEVQQAVDEGNIKLMWDNLLEIAVVEDPNKIEKFQESIERMAKKMAKADAEIKESLEILDGIEGIIRGLDNAEGTLKAQEVAIEQARVQMDRILDMQNEKNPNAGGGGQAIRQKMGVLTDQELAEQFERQAQEAAQRQAQEQAEAQAQDQTQAQSQNQGEKNYNS